MPRFHGYRWTGSEWEHFASTRHLCGLHLWAADLGLPIGEWAWTAW